ncbi:MAG: hypothetical protein ACSLE1_16010 [Sphingobium sp.]
MSITRYWRFAAYALAAALVVAVIWNWRGWTAQAQVGAAYGARMTCSCRYVEGRDMQSCKGDTEPGMWIVSISDSPESKSVTAGVPLMANRTARYRAGWGCLLDPPK